MHFRKLFTLFSSFLIYFRSELIHFNYSNQIITFFFHYHFSSNVTCFLGQSHDCPPNDGDELLESNDDEFPNSTTLNKDHQLFYHTTYERLYNCLYCSYSKNGFMCKICTVFYGDNPEPAHSSKGTWSHKGVLFKDNPGKKLWHGLMITKIPFVQKLTWK